MPESKTPHIAFVLIWETPGKYAGIFTSPGVMDDDSEVRSKWSLGARCAIGPTGCRITFLKPNGAAEKVGLKIGDIITKLGEKTIGDADLTTDHISPALKKAPDGKIGVEYLRSGATQTIQVVLDPVL